MNWHVCGVIAIVLHTPESMNSLLSDFWKEFRRGILGGGRNYLGELLGGFQWQDKGNQEEKQQENYMGKNDENSTNPIESY